MEWKNGKVKLIRSLRSLRANSKEIYEKIAELYCNYGNFDL